MRKKSARSHENTFNTSPVVIKHNRPTVTGGPVAKKGYKAIN
jgi:hypothetical protein